MLWEILPYLYRHAGLRSLRHMVCSFWLCVEELGSQSFEQPKFKDVIFEKKSRLGHITKWTLRKMVIKPNVHFYSCVVSDISLLHSLISSASKFWMWPMFYHCLCSHSVPHHSNWYLYFGTCTSSVCFNASNHRVLASVIQMPSLHYTLILQIHFSPVVEAEVLAMVLVVICSLTTMTFLASVSTCSSTSASWVPLCPLNIRHAVTPGPSSPCVYMCPCPNLFVLGHQSYWIGTLFT